MKNLIPGIFVLLLPIGLTGQSLPDTGRKKAGEVIQTIIRNTGAATVSPTVDVIKEGDPETPVTGIVTCMFATMDVLRKAVGKNCNLIIPHEPLYYNHLDDTKAFQNDAVFLEKQRYIQEHHLVIWRFHDYIHRMEPDGVLSGMVEKLRWKEYATGGRLDQFEFPETTLKEILRNLKETFPENTFYVVGNPDMKTRNIRLAPGAAGSAYHIKLLEMEKVDLVIAGEAPQWETYEYTRDAISQGKKKAVVFLGHIPSEESGMKFCAEWLKATWKDFPVYFIESGSSFWSY